MVYGVVDEENCGNRNFLGGDYYTARKTGNVRLCGFYQEDIYNLHTVLAMGLFLPVSLFRHTGCLCVQETPLIFLAGLERSLLLII